ncbi:hypothetical protein ACNAN0_02820 [Agrilactobacillus fermenti]|uniref:hypothetical protein n=1 Tax=Agrilactobacillus fermenti TaxID=2586909 RepID=UPI001E2D106A|nr:hypothetical protein [Agrilactobacillus fermenti]MCD2256349.1 hypothetical protein [Agrilactobacillus fermenti]
MNSRTARHRSENKRLNSTNERSKNRRENFHGSSNSARSNLIIGIILLVMGIWIFIAALPIHFSALFTGGDISSISGLLTALAFGVIGGLLIWQRQQINQLRTNLFLIVLGVIFILDFLTLGIFSDLKYYAWFGLLLGLWHYITTARSTSTRPLIQAPWFWISIFIMLSGILITVLV